MWLAEGTGAADAWLEHIDRDYDSPAILVPTVVLTEVITGYPADASTNRFLKMIDDPQEPGAFYLDLTKETATRAGVLRTEALRVVGLDRKRLISATDAHVVALAEERSTRHAVTIVTSDPGDMELLVGLTGRTNISVLGI